MNFGGLTLDLLIFIAYEFHKFLSSTSNLFQIYKGCIIIGISYKHKKMQVKIIIKRGEETLHLSQLLKLLIVLK